MSISKVLFVNRRLSVGGSERVMTLLANGMAEKGIDVDMVVLQDMVKTYEVSPKVNMIQFKHEGLNSALKPIKRIKDLRKVIKTGNYDSVISFMNIVNFYTLIAGIGYKKIVVSERADPRQTKSLSIKLARKFLYPMSYKLVFQTEDAKECFPENIQNKGFVIPNPINTDLPLPYAGERNKEVVATGRFTNQKNFKMAIDAFEMFIKDFPDYTLTIYGEGPLKSEIVDYANSKGLDNKIFFPGFVKDIIEKISKASIYISSSNFEGISNSMLEALAMGIPSVCTDCPVGGARMTIRDNENGILVPVGDTNALYEGMKKIARDKEFADKLSKNAIKVREDLSIEKIVDKWLKILN